MVVSRSVTVTYPYHEAQLLGRYLDVVGRYYLPGLLGTLCPGQKCYTPPNSRINGATWTGSVFLVLSLITPLACPCPERNKIARQTVLINIKCLFSQKAIIELPISSTVWMRYLTPKSR